MHFCYGIYNKMGWMLHTLVYFWLYCLICDLSLNVLTTNKQVYLDEGVIGPLSKGLILSQG